MERGAGWDEGPFQPKPSHGWDLGNPHPSVLGSSAATDVQGLGNEVGGILHPSGPLCMDLELLLVSPGAVTPQPSWALFASSLQQGNPLSLDSLDFQRLEHRLFLLLWDQFEDEKGNVWLDVGNAGNYFLQHHHKCSVKEAGKGLEIVRCKGGMECGNSARREYFKGILGWLGGEALE